MNPDLLAQHVDEPHDPARRHRLVLLDPRRLRCDDCQRTIVLPAPATSPTTSSPPQLHAPDRCQRHPGETHGRCGRCRAERLERVAEGNPFTPSADVEAGAAAVRAALVRRVEGAVA